MVSVYFCLIRGKLSIVHKILSSIFRPQRSVYIKSKGYAVILKPTYISYKNDVSIRRNYNCLSNASFIITEYELNF